MRKSTFTHQFIWKSSTEFGLNRINHKVHFWSYLKSYFKPLYFLLKLKWRTNYTPRSILRAVEYICINKSAVDKVKKRFKSAHSAVTNIPTKPWFKSLDHRFVLLIWHPFVIACVKSIYCMLHFLLLCRLPIRSSWLRSCQIW